MATDAEVRNFVKEALECASQEKALAVPEKARQATDFLYSCAQTKLKQPALWSTVQSVLEESTLLLIWRWLHDAIGNVGLSNDKSIGVYMYWHIFGVLWDLTDTSSKVCKQAIEAGLVKAYLDDLKKPEFLDSRTDLNCQYQHYATGCMGTLINLAEKHPDETSNCVAAENGVEVIRQYLTSSTDKMRIRAIILISNFLTGDEKDKLTTVLNDDDVAYLHTILFDSVTSKDHTSSKFGRHTLETLNAIARIANLSENFVKSLVKHGFLGIAEQLLTAPTQARAITPAAKNEANREITYCTVEEKLSLTKTLWSFAFYDGGRVAFASKPSLHTSVEEVAKYGDTPQLRLAASGVLWELSKYDTEKQTKTQIANDIRNTSPKGHVMLSYCGDKSKPVVLKIRQYLNAHDVPTWLDEDDMAGSTVEAMAKAVEDSAVVLMCYGQGYSQSANCRAEAMYAFSTQKIIAPVRMQKYKPSGWLGLIVGTDLDYDFSDPSKFEKNAASLLSFVKSELDSTFDEVDLGCISASKGKEAAVIKKSVKHCPSPARSAHADVRNWTEEDVQNWAVENNIKANRVVKNMNGERLNAMSIVNRVAPTYFYEGLEKKMGLTFEEVLDFVGALSTLDS